MSGPAGRVDAQAKINLLLRILGRELSGHHQIETVFLRLDLADRIAIRCAGTSRTIDCDDRALPVRGLVGPAGENLAYRAAVAFSEAAAWPRGFAIEIEKQIPVGGGLGGGSADAGGVLRLLNALAPQPLPAERLRRIALALGADVPFLCAEMAMALAWGRGERLHAVPALPSREVALAMPPFSIATRDAYGWLDADRSGDLPLEPTIQGEMLLAWDRVAHVMRNDLQPSVVKRHPAIGQLVDAMRATTPLALMSGSGSTVFGIFEERQPLALGATARIVWTRTAERVVPVERSA